MAALRPGEYPGKGPQGAPAVTSGARRRARSDVHAFDHVERRGRAKVVEEPCAAEHQFAVSHETARGDGLHRRRVRGRYRRAFSPTRPPPGPPSAPARPRARVERPPAPTLICTT